MKHFKSVIVDVSCSLGCLIVVVFNSLKSTLSWSKLIILLHFHEKI